MAASQATGNRRKVTFAGTLKKVLDIANASKNVTYSSTVSWIISGVDLQ